jgi:hypothetical protein
MKTKKMILLFSGIIMLGLVMFISCKKENRMNEPQQLNVYITDDPVRYDSVNMEILSVEAKVDTDFNHMNDDHHGDNDLDGDDHGHHSDEYGTWVTLNFTPGVYNISGLRNGLDSMIASANLAGTVRKIRLKLGNNNSVIDSGIVHPLLLQNPADTLLYVHLHDRHRGHEHFGANSVWIDFDLGRSIINLNGQYYFVPRIHPFCDSNFGEIEGRVLPSEANAIVVAYNSTDTATAIPNPDGYFKIRGMEFGTYSVLIDGQTPFVDTTLTNVQVTNNGDTRLGVITLHQ